MMRSMPTFGRGTGLACGFVILLSGLLIIGVFVHPRVSDSSLPPSDGSIAAATKILTGQNVTTDYLADYAGAKSLLRGVDPYRPLSDVIEESGGPSWNIEFANPHPPSLLTINLPLALLPYRVALAAWSLAMVAALIVTLRISGLPVKEAVAVGAALTFLWPTAYAIGNPVLLIGLGTAIAFRYRHHSWLAALGLTLAIASKGLGLVLVLPFLLGRNWRPVAYAAGMMTFLMVVPQLLYSRTWSSYLSNGRAAVTSNFERTDNASIVAQGHQMGIASPILVLLIVIVAGLVGFRIRDGFWPSAWIGVACSPISWMYSLTALIPLFALAVVRRQRNARLATLGAAALLVGTPPLGTPALWSTPAILAIALYVVSTGPPTEFWPSRRAQPRVEMGSAVDRSERHQI